MLIYVAMMRAQIERIEIVRDLICYCFGYSEDDIHQDYQENGKSTIMEKIQMEKKFGNCQCATKNPKGIWCIGDVHQVVAKLKGKPALNVISWECDYRKMLKMRTENRSNDIFTLDQNLDPLKQRFNTDSSLIRFIALLSPTCPL